MTAQSANSLTIFAPAKLNLYLHVTGQCDDGYHTLDSLMGFVDIGDSLTIESAPTFTFSVTGPYAGSFSPSETETSAISSNLVVRAAHLLAAHLEKPLAIKITLTKNLPLASGIGGGSADAAATLRGLLEWWDIKPQTIAPALDKIALSLGADVPVCMSSHAAFVRGIGEIINPAPPLPALPALIVNPNLSCATATIFKNYKAPYKDQIALPSHFKETRDFLNFLQKQENDLTQGATQLVPEITDILEILAPLPGCTLARMSGAGATVFALFDSMTQAKTAAKTLTQNHPDWWIKTGLLKNNDCHPERSRGICESG